jgi:hypothetical protein
VKLAELVPHAQRRNIQPRNGQPEEAVIGAVPSRLVVDVTGRSFTRFRAAAAVDQSSLISEINPRVRFFVFSEEPDPRLLVRIEGPAPTPTAWTPGTLDQTIGMLYRHAVSRPPERAEAAAAKEFFDGKLSADGLEDLLWAVILSPEFQYIR